MATLRQEIRAYETKTGKKVKCFGVMRCRYCPMSAIGCPGPRFIMRRSGASGGEHATTP